MQMNHIENSINLRIDVVYFCLKTFFKKFPDRKREVVSWYHLLGGSYGKSLSLVNLAFGRSEVTGKKLEKGRLAGAVLSHDSDL